MTLLRAGVTVTVLVCSSLSWAEQAEPQVVPMTPGLWEITTRPDFKNVPTLLIPKVDQVCLSEAAIKEGRIPVRAAPICEVSGGIWNKNLLNLKIACKEAPPDAKIPAELVAEKTSFTSFIELNPDIKYQHSGKLISPQCP